MPSILRSALAVETTPVMVAAVMNMTQDRSHVLIEKFEGIANEHRAIKDWTSGDSRPRGCESIRSGW
jgi:hypothetical protein